MALRSIRLTSGLFDTSGASESAFEPSLADPELKASDLSTFDAADLLAVLDTDDSLPDLSDLPMASALGEASLDTNTNFLEGFRNLDEYIHWPIFGEEIMNFTTGVEVLDQAEVDKLEVVNPLKRVAEEADPVSVPANPDHDDYVAKVKQPRPSTSSEAEGEPVGATKSTTYRERRRKNNIASRRSRETRKQKFTCMELKAQELEAANEALEKKVVVLEDLTKRMKDILVQRLSRNN